MLNVFVMSIYKVHAVAIGCAVDREVGNWHSPDIRKVSWTLEKSTKILQVSNAWYSTVFK